MDLLQRSGGHLTGCICFQNAGIAGCEFIPVELQNTMGDSVASDLFEMRPTGWAGMAPSTSGVRVLEECPTLTNCLTVDAWDGSDVFVIWPLPRYILATAEVRTLIRKHRFSGVKVVPIRELPKPIAGTLTPGNVRDWFAENRARKIELEIEAAIRA